MVEYKCSKCDYKFKIKTKFVKHCESKSTKLFYCKYCNFKSCTSSGIFQHIKLRHKDIKIRDKNGKLNCEFCDFTTNHSMDLALHKTLKHKECQDCQVTKNSLEFD